MREIKFRAWNNRNKVMTTPYIWLNDENLVGQSMIGAPSHVMQFTGLTDKNGVDIYEGDVLLWSSAELTMVCEWGYEDCAFTLRNTHSKGAAMMNDDYMKNYIVIGDIHQHPELLK